MGGWFVGGDGPTAGQPRTHRALPINAATLDSNIGCMDRGIN